MFVMIGVQSANTVPVCPIPDVTLTSTLLNNDPPMSLKSILYIPLLVFLQTISPPAGILLVMVGLESATRKLLVEDHTPVLPALSEALVRQ